MLFQIGVSIKDLNRMPNSVDPAETHYEPSHQDLPLFAKKKKKKKKIFCNAKLRELNIKM